MHAGVQCLRIFCNRKSDLDLLDLFLSLSYPKYCISFSSQNDLVACGELHLRKMPLFVLRQNVAPIRQVVTPALKYQILIGPSRTAFFGLYCFERTDPNKHTLAYVNNLKFYLSSRQHFLFYHRKRHVLVSALCSFQSFAIIRDRIISVFEIVAEKRFFAR